MNSNIQLEGLLAAATFHSHNCSANRFMVQQNTPGATIPTLESVIIENNQLKRDNNQLIQLNNNLLNENNHLRALPRQQILSQSSLSYKTISHQEIVVQNNEGIASMESEVQDLQERSDVHGSKIRNIQVELNDLKHVVDEGVVERNIQREEQQTRIEKLESNLVETQSTALSKIRQFQNAIEVQRECTEMQKRQLEEMQTRLEKVEEKISGSKKGQSCKQRTLEKTRTKATPVRRLMRNRTKRAQ